MQVDNLLSQLCGAANNSQQVAQQLAKMANELKNLTFRF